MSSDPLQEQPQSPVAIMEDDEEAKAQPEEEQAPLCPLIAFRQWVHDMSRPGCPAEVQLAARSSLEAYVTEHHAAPFYKYLGEVLPPSANWPGTNPDRMKQLEAGLQAAIEAADRKLAEAKETQGETEVREALLARAQIHLYSGDKAATLAAFAATEEKTVGSGQKIEIHFSLMRLALALQDLPLFAQQAKITRELLEAGGDWERRNLFSVYEAVGMLQRRELSRAAPLLLKSVATFTCTQLFSYNDFVRLAVVAALAATDRATHRQQVINSPDVLGVIDEIPGLRELAFSLYRCQYGRFFAAVVAEVDRMQENWLLGPLADFLLRELRIVAYKQFLTSYRSVQLASMARAFAVSPDFLDEELSRFIGVGRLNCQIDRVAGVLSTTRPGERQRQYAELLRTGDLLLDRVNKLTRIGST